MALVVGGFWALLVFSRDKRAKASKLLLKLEEEYRKHLETFLQIEVSYDTSYKNAIRKMNNPTLGPLTADERKCIERLESALRYMGFCAHLERLGIDSGLLGQLNRYYLDVLIRADREDLRTYIEKYWSGVWRWAHLAGRSRPERMRRIVKLALGVQLEAPSAPNEVEPPAQTGNAVDRPKRIDGA